MNDNVFIGTGLLTQFQERTTPNGNRICSMSILLPSEKNQEKNEGTFLAVESWNVSSALAKLLTSNVKKCRVFIKGRLRMDYWVDKQTKNKRTQLKTIADVVSFVPLKPQSSRPPQNAVPQTQNSSSQDAEIPF